MSGVLLANLLKRQAGDFGQMLNIWYLEQFAYADISLERLFFQLLWKRGKFTFFFFLFGGWAGYVMASTLLLCFLAVTFGFFLAMAVIDLGIKGIVFAFAGVFPQIFFYIAAIFWCRFCGKNIRCDRMPGYGIKNRVRQMTERIVFYAVAVVLITGGVFVETYVSTLVLKMIVKNF